jgi:hypothetical protein
MKLLGIIECLSDWLLLNKGLAPWSWVQQSGGMEVVSTIYKVTGQCMLLTISLGNSTTSLAEA